MAAAFIRAASHRAAIHFGFPWPSTAATAPASFRSAAKKNLDLEFEFQVDDHIGCLAVTPQFLIGGNWDSREFYVWDHQGRLQRKVPNAAGNGYQDIKFESGVVVASGILPNREGAIDRLAFPSFQLLSRLKAGKTGRGALFTREGMAIHGDRLYLLPEDDPSRLFLFEWKP